MKQKIKNEWQMHKFFSICSNMNVLKCYIQDNRNTLYHVNDINVYLILIAYVTLFSLKCCT